jgi:hypothetical protein
MPALITWTKELLGLDKKPAAKQPSEEDLGRAEDEGMAPPDVETPSPHLDNIQ